MIWISALGVFDIIWSLLLFLLFLASRYDFIGGLLLGLFFLVAGIEILRKKKNSRRVFLKWSIPLGIISAVSLLPFNNPERPIFLRMSVAAIFEFSSFWILFPIIVNFIILSRPEVKEQFRP